MLSCSSLCCHGNQQPRGRLPLIKSCNGYHPSLPNPGVCVRAGHNLGAGCTRQPATTIQGINGPGDPHPRGNLGISPGASCSEWGGSPEDSPLTDVFPRRPHILFSGDAQVQMFPFPPPGIIFSLSPTITGIYEALNYGPGTLPILSPRLQHAK